MNVLLLYRIKPILLVFLFVVTSCDQSPFISAKEQSARHQLEEWTGKLSTLSELGTVEYVVSKVVTASDDATWYKFGDRKILFTCKATLKAGIDLSKLSDDDIQANYKNKSISVKLPKPELLSFNMNPEDIILVYSKVAITRSAFTLADRINILTQGEINILEDLPNLGILIDAEKNAQSFLEIFLKHAGYEKINIEFKRQ